MWTAPLIHPLRPIAPAALHVALRLWEKRIEETWARYRSIQGRDEAMEKAILEELDFLINGFK